VALVAPSGFGKTTTLAQVLRESEAQTVWYELPAVETGPMELARALLSILAVDASSNHPDQLLRTLALTLETFTDGLLLVLEGADHLNTEAGAWLLNLAASLHDGQHVILTGYELEALPMTWPSAAKKPAPTWALEASRTIRSPPSRRSRVGRSGLRSWRVEPVQDCHRPT
jgi:hypothetical protein